MKALTQLLFLIGLTGLIASTPAQPAVSATAVDGDAQINGVARAQSETAAAWQWTAGAERQLASEPGSPTAAVLPQAVREAKEAHARKIDELDRLARQLAELRTAVTVEHETNDNADKLIRQWEEKLAAEKAELAELARKEAELMRQLTDDSKASGLAMGVHAGERKAIHVAVRNGFVSPLAKPYFRGRAVRWTDGDAGAEIIADQDGVPLGQALEPGGWLSKALDEADAEKNYVNILLPSDSIATYYGLLKELRQRKLHHQWDTWNGKSFFIITRRANGNASPQDSESGPIFK